MQQNFYIRKWSAWPPLDGKETLTQTELLSSVPKMLKRRLTPLARMVFAAANQCIEETKAKAKLPIVFCSTHGELAKTFEMMKIIEEGDEISPTAYSLSVHNAIAGLFSIAYKNTLESTAVTAGEEGIAVAFIEAIGLLFDGHQEVIIVFYDEPLVPFFPSKPFQLTSSESQAICLTIASTGPGIPIRFSCLKKTGNDGEQPVQMPLLMRFLELAQHQAQADLLLHTPRHSWYWEKT